MLWVWAKPSLQLKKVYCVPVAPAWGEVTLMLWVLPGTQLKLCGAVKVVPSTTIARPDGLVATVMDAVALKLAVTLRGALMVTDWGLVVPIRSPVQLANWKPAFAVAVNCTTWPLL